MTRLVLSELFVTNLLLFEHQQKKLLVSWQFSGPYGVTKYGNSWRKDVVNQCLECDCLSVTMSLCVSLSQSHTWTVDTLIKFHTTGYTNTINYTENAWVPLVLITAAALLLRESQILTVLSPLAVAKWSGLVGCQHNWSTLSPCPRKMCSLLCYILKKHALCEFMHLIHGFHQHLLIASDNEVLRLR